MVNAGGTPRLAGGGGWFTAARLVQTTPFPPAAHRPMLPFSAAVNARPPRHNQAMVGTRLFFKNRAVLYSGFTFGRPELSHPHDKEGGFMPPSSSSGGDNSGRK